MRYRTIVADPPWPYDEGFASGGRNHMVNGERPAPTEPIRRSALPYAAMDLDDITALPIPCLAMGDCRLFLWATSRYLPTAVGMLGAWGFAYKQLLVWDKRPNVNPFTGSVAPNACEFLIVATHGKPRRLTKWPASIVTVRKARTDHSAKPEVFLDLVEQVSPGPYLELFARRNRLGWDTWGNEALEHVEIETA